MGSGPGMALGRQTPFVTVNGSLLGLPPAPAPAIPAELPAPPPVPPPAPAAPLAPPVAKLPPEPPLGSPSAASSSLLQPESAATSKTPTKVPKVFMVFLDPGRGRLARNRCPPALFLYGAVRPPFPWGFPRGPRAPGTTRCALRARRPSSRNRRRTRTCGRRSGRGRWSCSPASAAYRSVTPGPE